MKSLLVLIFLFATAAQADVTGTWKGRGIYDSSMDGKIDVDVTVNLTQEATTLKVEDCWTYSTTIKYDLCFIEVYQIVGSALWFQGNEIGSIEENSVNFAYTIPGVQAQVSIKTDGTMDFKYTAKDDFDYLNMTTTGLVKDATVKRKIRY